MVDGRPLYLKPSCGFKSLGLVIVARAYGLGFAILTVSAIPRGNSRLPQGLRTYSTTKRRE